MGPSASGRARMKPFHAALVVLNVSIAFAAWAEEQGTPQPAGSSPAGQEAVPNASSEQQKEAPASSQLVAQTQQASPGIPPMAQQPTGPVSPQAAPPPPSALKMGNLSIALYGFLLFDAHWNEVGFGTAPFSDPDAELNKKVNASGTRYDFPIFANGMPGGFLMSIRQSRLGARL